MACLTFGRDPSFAQSHAAAQPSGAQTTNCGSFTGGLNLGQVYLNCIQRNQSSEEIPKDKWNISVSEYSTASRATLLQRSSAGSRAGELLSSARVGDASAALLYSIYLADQNPPPPETQKQDAVNWLRLAATQGQARAEYEYGRYLERTGAKASAIVGPSDWTRRAATAGNALAQNSIGAAYSNSQAMQTDYAEAMKWFLLASAQKLGVASANIGLLYEFGHGVDRDYGKAAHFYEDAVLEGSTFAAVRLGGLYEQGRGVVVDEGKALALYEAAADKSNIDAYARLGSMYEDGRGVTRDLDQAIYWFRRAATTGDLSASFALGRVIDSKDSEIRYSLPEDELKAAQSALLDEALRWYKAAYDGGVELDAAGTRIGRIYIERKRCDLATQFFRTESDRGRSFAAYQLGLMYRDGDCVAKDRRAAISWLRVAVKLGGNAKTDLDELTSPWLVRQLRSVF